MSKVNQQSVEGRGIPEAPKKCNAPTVDDVIALSAFTKGLDPAWRYVTIHQHCTATKRLNTNFNADTLENAAKGNPTARGKIQQTLEFLSDKKHAFAGEVHLMLVARERYERFQRGLIQEFADLPFELRFTLNLFRPDTHGPLNDFSIPEAFRTSCGKGIDWALGVGSLTKDSDGKIRLSESATIKLTVRAKRAEFPPEMCQHLLTVLRAENLHVTGKKSAALELKQLMPQNAVVQAECLTNSYLRKGLQSSPLSALASPVIDSQKFAQRLVIIRNALESLERQKGGDLRRVHQDFKKALSVMADADTKQEMRLGKTLLRALSCLPLLQAGQDGVSTYGLSFTFLQNALPLLEKIKYGHEESTDLLIKVITRPTPTSTSSGQDRIDYHESVVQSCQRAATDVIGTWLKRDKLSPELQRTLFHALLSQMSPLAPPRSISSALYWIHENRTKLSAEQVSRPIMRLAAEWEGRRLYHHLFIEAKALRDGEGLRLMGVLEVAVSLLNEKRLNERQGKELYLAIQRLIRGQSESHNRSETRERQQTAERLLEQLRRLSDIPLRSLKPAAAAQSKKSP